MSYRAITTQMPEGSVVQACLSMSAGNSESLLLITIDIDIDILGFIQSTNHFFRERVFEPVHCICFGVCSIQWRRVLFRVFFV